MSQGFSPPAPALRARHPLPPRQATIRARDIASNSPLVLTMCGHSSTDR